MACSHPANPRLLLPPGLHHSGNNFWHLQILILCCNHIIATGGKIISHLIFFPLGKESMPISLRGLQKILCKIMNGVQKSKRQRRGQAASYWPLFISDSVMACSSVAMGSLKGCYTFIFAHDTQGRHEPLYEKAHHLGSDVLGPESSWHSCAIVSEVLVLNRQHHVKLYFSLKDRNYTLSSKLS